MMEKRKLFYAISFMLLTCCQIITMLPHNAANSESEDDSVSAAVTIILSTSSDSSENETVKILRETESNGNKTNNNNSDFLIVATERRREKGETTVFSDGVWETQENDSRPTDNIDDLIFIDKRPINQHHQQHEKQQQQHHSSDHLPHHREHLRNEQKHFEFHHVTMDGGGGGSSNTNSNSNINSNEDGTDSLTDTTYSSMIVVDDDEDIADDGVPHEIELQPDINEEVTPLNVTPLDLSDFLSLIPATKVKTIVNHYYHNDPEVQRAHAFMSSRDFLMLKQHIIAVPEMSAFLHYLNNSGLDLVKFVTALTNLTSYESANTTKAINYTTDLNAAGSAERNAAIDVELSTKKVAKTNDIEYTSTHKQSDKITPTISNIEIQNTTNMPKTTDSSPATQAAEFDDGETTTQKEQLNGLHGLVDSVLDVLPQDQILATFFDKLEANEQFSKLVDNIGSPEFAKILNNMQSSMPLRNLIFTLHNNGIYIMRIVDSLKSYFFLGGF